MYYLIWLFLGLILGVILIAYSRSGSKQDEKKILSIGLIVASTFYVGFALIWGDVIWILYETAGVLIFAVFVWLASRFSYYWLALGWALHPAWDVLIHVFGTGRFIAPEWYAIACITFDLLIAGYILCTPPTE